MSDQPTPGETPDLVKEAYEQGRRDTIAALTPKPSLFEAAKRWAVSNPNFTHRLAYHEGFDQLEAEYGEKLIQSDRDLLIGIADKVRRGARTAPQIPKPPRAPIPVDDDDDRVQMTRVQGVS